MAGGGIEVARPALVLALVATALMLPSLILGTLPSHSFVHNLTWAPQFAEQFRAGILYPRWMPDSFGGLGAPSFYFYSPLGFWIDAVLNVVTFNSIPAFHRLSLTSTVLLWGSGVGFLAWLRLEGVAARTALIGAIAYMVAPYHLVDHYVRGAFAEFAAFTVMPFLFCGLSLVARRHPLGGPSLAVAYAALVASHLPTALLISLTAVPAYVLFTAWRVRTDDRWFLVRCAAGFSLGLALAALCLWPALRLQDAISIKWLWTWGFKVEDSYLLFPARWEQGLSVMVIACSLAAGWLWAVFALAGLGDMRGALAAHARVLLWAGVCVGTIVLMSGLVPWQHLPLVSQVGFAWRLLIVVEFAAITALCLAPWRRRSGAVRRLLWLAAIAFVPGVSLLGKEIVQRVEFALSGEPRMPLQDAREYLPAGYPMHPGAAYLDIGLELVKDVPLIACQPSPRVCRAEPGRFGDLRIEVAGEQPTRVTLRRFAFPAWQLDPPLPLVASDRLRLVSFTAPAGPHAWLLTRRTLPEEGTGGFVSAIALLLLLVWSGWAGLRTALVAQGTQ